MTNENGGIFEQVFQYYVFITLRCFCAIENKNSMMKTSISNVSLTVSFKKLQV